MTSIVDAFPARPVSAPEAPADQPQVATKPDSRPVRSRVAPPPWLARRAEIVWSDLRRAWWTPASLPTVRQAWAQRMPDRSTVPGENGLLYAAWVGWAHTVGLVVPALSAAVAGLLAAAVFAAMHPARTLLAAMVAVPLIMIWLAT